MQDESQVTVGIPFYAGTNIRQFQAAVDSILSQTLLPDKIHLIQDGKIGQELHLVVEAYKTALSERIEHIVIEQNLGLAHALNVSILQTTTGFYARMDSDDISLPNRLLMQCEFLKANPDIGIVGGWAWEFSSENPAMDFLKKMPTKHSDLAQMLHYRSPFIHPSVMFRVRDFAVMGLYNSSYRIEEDAELWARAFKKGIRFANIPEPLLYYRASGVIKRRSSWAATRNWALAKFSVNTLSPKLNALKVGSILFRVLPDSIKTWGYKNLRTPSKH